MLDATKPLRHSAWSSHGVALLDFGAAIDLRLYPPGTELCGDGGAADGFACGAMRDGGTWTTEVRALPCRRPRVRPSRVSRSHPASSLPPPQGDAFAAGASAHFLLFGEYMVAERSADGRWAAAPAGRARAWDAEVWAPLFDALLNGAPDLGELADGLQRHLDASAPRRKELRDALRAQYAALGEAGAIAP